MKEPQWKEDAAAPPVAEQEAVEPQDAPAEPRAYAFDGWAMVPLEFDPA